MVKDSIRTETNGAVKYDRIRPARNVRVIKGRIRTEGNGGVKNARTRT